MCNRALIFIFFSILRQIYSDSDEEDYEPWDPYSALIQTQGPWPLEKQFPTDVRISHTFRAKVYFKENESEHGIITFAMCPKPNTGHHLGRYCNFPGESFPIGNYLKGKTLNERCSMTVEPAMEKVIIDDTHATCTNDGNRYKFVYYRCKTGRWNRSFLKDTHIYDACYHDTHKQLVYGYYSIETPDLLRNPLLKGEREFQFQYQTKAYFQHFFNHFENVAEYLYTENDSYVPRMVLPPEFLPFALQRKPLYHYMNLAPMDAELLPAWRLLMKKLKYKIAEMNGPVSVAAGLLDQLGNQYLGYMHPESENDDEEGEDQNEEVEPIPEIPIPHIWWILLYNSGRTHGVVIMMHNEPYNRNMNGQFYDNRRCSTGLCSSANVSSAIPNPNRYPSYIYCCLPYAITGEFGIGGLNDLLELPD